MLPFNDKQHWMHCGYSTSRTWSSCDWWYI